MSDMSFPSRTSALEIIQGLGLEVRIEYPLEPVLTERDRLMQRLLRVLEWHLDSRLDSLDWE